MVALTNDEKRVVELFRNLPAERRPHVMLAMAASDSDGWKRYQAQGEERLRALAANRGLNWDAMTDEHRQDFVSDLVRDNRP